MLIPCATAKPLNSFLKSELTLKLSDFSFSLSAVASASVRLLANGHPLEQRPPLPGHMDISRNTDFCLSYNLESQK